MKQTIVLHMVHRKSGGGAEFIASEINKGLKNYDIESFILYLQNHKNESLGKNEFCLNAKTLNPFFNIRKFHNFLESKFNDKKIIIHTHLTWDFYLLAISNYKFLTKFHTEHMVLNKRRIIPFMNFIERAIYNRYSNIISVSKHARLSLLSFIGRSFSNKTLVIHNGIRRFNPKSQITKNNKPVIVSVGSLNRIKGFDLSIKALALIPECFYQYLIIGEGPQIKHLKKLIFKYNLNDKVKFLGYRKDIGKILRSADLALFPSRHESFCLAALEALSVGLPIVTSNVDGMKQIVKCKASTITNVENPEIFSKAILSNIRKKINNEKIKKDAIIFSQKYSMEKMCFEYSLLYKKYIKNN